MTPPPPTPADSQAGFTIIEVMVAAVLLLVGLVATLTLVEQAASTTNKTRAREQATSLQRELVEAARSVPYDQLTANGVGGAVRTRPAVGDSSVTGSGWTIRRRNTTYTVAMGVCTVDDPRDGTGAHEANVFCGPSPASPTDANLDGTVDGLVAAGATTCAGGGCSATPDTNPADYKRIVSVVRWAEVSNVQTSQVNNPGIAAAPAVTNLTADTNTISTSTTTSLGLTATTSGTPSVVALYLDGTSIGSATAAGASTWTGAWTLGPITGAVGAQPSATEILDGSYELSAKAFDQYGQYGATRSQTILVNRRQAFAPARVEAGRNGDGVEIEWTPAKERDSEGFRVDRRLDGGAWTQVCARAVRTGCRDNAPPDPLVTIEYSVVGFDRNSVGAVRAGDRSPAVLVPLIQPAKPEQPASMQATRVNGNVVLTWTAPSGPTPDHYNIYRDGQDYADRLDNAYFNTGQPLTYTDTRSGTPEHDYWITAVNTNLGESPQLGPVRK